MATLKHNSRDSAVSADMLQSGDPPIAAMQGLRRRVNGGGPATGKLRATRFDVIALLLIVVCVLSIWELRLALSYDEMTGEVSSQSFQPYFGNVTIGDFAIAVIYIWLWSLSEFRGFVGRLQHTWMGFACGGLSVCVLFISPLSVEQNTLYNIKQAVQFAADFVVVVPVFAFLVAYSSDVSRLFLMISLFFVVVILCGVVLYFFAGRQDVFRTSGDVRFYPNVAYDAMQYCVLAYAGVQILSSSSHGRKLVALLSIASFVLLAGLAASRTMFVAMIAVSAGMVAFGAYLRFRSVVLYCVVSAIVIFVVYSFMFVGVTDVSVFMVREEGFSDLQRNLLISEGLTRVSQSLPGLLLGLGWDKSGIHNFALQTFVDAGAFVAAFLMLLIFTPFLVFWRFRRVAPNTCRLGAGVLIGFVFFYSFNALPTLRVYWIPMGIVVGLAMRARMAALGPTRP